MDKRKFIKNTLYSMTGLSFLSGIYSWQIEPFRLEFVYKKMPVKNLPKALVGKVLMQISDVHVGNRFDYNFIIESFKVAQELDPDIVVYTGDYVTYEGKEQFKQLEEVLKYTVQGKLGTLGILGNHDYGINWAQQVVANKISNLLTQNGIDLLQNRSKEVEGLNFIGMDDYWGLNFNPKEALRHYRADEPSIVLCHNPDVCDLDVWSGYQGWILSGHTHGGQCKPPFLKAPLLPVKNKRYDAGEIDLIDGRTLYINRALGHLWQVRFNVRPEITVFELEGV